MALMPHDWEYRGCNAANFMRTPVPNCSASTLSRDLSLCGVVNVLNETIFSCWIKKVLFSLSPRKDIFVAKLSLLNDHWCPGNIATFTWLLIFCSWAPFREGCVGSRDETTTSTTPMAMTTTTTTTTTTTSMTLDHVTRRQPWLRRWR